MEVWLDEEQQFVVQRVTGRLGTEEFLRLYRLTGECSERLQDPSNVRVLVDARKMLPMSLKVRTLAIDHFHEGVMRMAVFGGSRLTRVIGSFVSILIGQRRVRHFETEEQARAWLALQVSVAA